jgi:hypothetical protein
MVKIILLAFAVWSTSVALACDCAPESLSEAKGRAEVVFRGTITAIRGGKVSFRVDRVWKGNVGRTFDMPELCETSACIGFLPTLLQVGNDLLVFAWRLRRDPSDNEYFTSICTRTQLSQSAGEDFARLGRGKPPH